MELEVSRPANLAETLNLLTAKRDQVKILAGGTDLMLDLRRKKYQIAGIVDITKLNELKDIKVEDRFVRIGSLVTFTKLADEKLLQKQVRFLAEAASLVGAPQIRNQATIGGNIANASPAADSVVPLVALDAVLSVVSSSGAREVPINQVLAGVGKTNLAADELITEIKFKLPSTEARSTFVKFGRRNALAIARMSVGILLDFAGNQIRDAKVALGAVAPNPFRAKELENLLINKTIEQIDAAEIIACANKVVSQTLGSRPSAKWKNEAIRGLMRQAMHKIGIW